MYRMFIFLSRGETMNQFKTIDFKGNNTSTMGKRLKTL